MNNHFDPTVGKSDGVPHIIANPRFRSITNLNWLQYVDDLQCYWAENNTSECEYFVDAL